MSDVLTALLPESAAALYQHLLDVGRLRIDDEPELAGSSDMRHLVEAGFARERYVDEPVIVPVEPSRAVEQALLAAQHRLLEEHRALLRVREQMGQLQRSYVAGLAPAASGRAVELLTDPAEIGALSVELCLSAQQDFSILETAHFRRTPDPRSVKMPPKAVLDRGVRFRNVYARAVLELPGADEMVRRCAEGGWDLRVLPALPMKMVLVDEAAALLPVDPTGMEGAVLVRSPVIVAGLRMTFELLWQRATPLTDGTAERLSGVRARVLQLMVAGLTDGAIGRQLGISERTVRRHVSQLLELLGADNRITAAAVAVREGWIA